MKKLILSAGIMALLCAGAAAQEKKKAKPLKSPESPAIRMEHTSANAAKAPAAGSSTYEISDPVVNFYNGRVSGAIPDEDVWRPIIGMPKLRYGVAHGRLLFMNTIGNSNGGNTGGGAVGTGTSPGAVGISGVAPGVNGKNFYAGPGIYGNRVRLSGSPVTLPPSRLRDRDADNHKP
ncbi:hypothetical protein EPD60_15330 [Flaviaesturariibacter flavus]|uniref:DUF4237 domain-containing protein n=1 Tax=Flaviaesturariibacter flavus TaxID=2502780 RepID=A0A4V2NV98_9BACT|nr:hypothetical protein [Flaviaesturariibacter flavus]TCJ12636.1 hypothetical protein EPD60_15330 [Flaviaesturariibacter flavus]